MKFTIYYIVLILVFISCNDAQLHGQAKLISVPQQGPDTRMLKNNYVEWEKTLPFEGLSINFNSNSINNGSSVGYFGREQNELCFTVFKNNAQIKYEDYTNAIKDLQSAKFQKFKNNFMILSVFDNNWTQWTDDKSWDHLLSNLTVASQIAYKSGLKGIILDTETYGSPQNLNLLFYCEQFINRTLKRNAKTAYVQVNKVSDQNTLEDLFPKSNDRIYWKDANDVADGIKLERVSFNIFKDKDGRFYYPLLDPKYKDEIKLLVADVEKRGRQLVMAINKSFPTAEIMLTCGPSYVKEVLATLNGLSTRNNYLRTEYGLLVAFTKGMLDAIGPTGMKLIDGQEQTYYHKTQEQFRKSQLNYLSAGDYYSGRTKENYFKHMVPAIGLYARPITPRSNRSERFFSESDIINSFNFAASNKSVKYIWVYEESETYWYLDRFKDRYLNKGKNMSKIGDSQFNQHIQNVRKGINSRNRN